jgi:GTP cyclohydrolase I
MDYDVSIEGTTSKTGHTIWLSVTVPVTSLCPCSKKISDYGAHNQRSEIRITVEPAGAINLDELIRIAEREASSELFAILKRPDEKAVTERAYDNPKFVEDLVRDVAQALHHHQAVKSFEVTVENFESIHNHSAIATIKHQR